jgi:hypothetical protein
MNFEEKETFYFAEFFVKCTQEEFDLIENCVISSKEYAAYEYFRMKEAAYLNHPEQFPDVRNHLEKFIENKIAVFLKLKKVFKDACRLYVDK